MAFLLALNVYGQTSLESGDGEERKNIDFEQMDPYMSDLYIKGPYLIYDCVSKHWVCTGQPEYERCEQWREGALERKRENLRCAPLRQFSSREDCHREQMKMIHMAGSARFCIHPEVKSRQRRY